MDKQGPRGQTQTQKRSAQRVEVRTGKMGEHRASRAGVRKAKTHLELNLAREGKKSLSQYICDRR